MSGRCYCKEAFGLPQDHPARCMTTKCKRWTKEQSKGSDFLDELITLLSEYCGEAGLSESATETLGRLLEELEGYRRRALASDIREYLRDGGPADALSFALQNSPKYDNVPGAVIQRIIDKEADKLAKQRT